jgi:hypothetical protein
MQRHPPTSKDKGLAREKLYNQMQTKPNQPDTSNHFVSWCEKIDGMDHSW